MKLLELEGKRILADKFQVDLQAGALRGVHFHKKGDFKKDADVIEIVVGRELDYIFAIEVFLVDGVVRKLRRVKFQAMCGGLRGKDHLLKRFPPSLLGEAEAETVLRDYLEDLPQIHRNGAAVRRLSPDKEGR